MKETITIEKHFDEVSRDYDFWKRKSWYYYKLLKLFFADHIKPGQKVLEIGCGTGDIVSYLKPKNGMGIDISKKMVQKARKKHPQIRFNALNVYRLNLKEKFRFIVLADLVDHLPDIFLAMNKIKKVSTSNTRVIVSTINPFWEPLLHLAENLKMKMPEGWHNWVPLPDLINIAEVAGFKVLHSGYMAYIPKYIPLISDFGNNHLSKLPLIKNFGFAQYLVLQVVTTKKPHKLLNVSVVIPAFNEQQNIVKCVKRIPSFGRSLEVIVVDDGSTDKTSSHVEKHMLKDTRVKLIKFKRNKGKVWAVKAGLDRAKGDVLMILDADMAVPPEELPHFYEILQKNRAQFVNGTRMIYPMEKEAMRYLNLLGNKFFGFIFSWILGQRVSDTLCGTKAFYKRDYRKITLGGEPWGDFDLLFGAAKLKLNIKEFPVHYHKRIYGKSKMKALKHGLLLARMCLVGAYEIKVKPFFQQL